jgi:hypothetical protein
MPCGGLYWQIVLYREWHRRDRSVHDIQQTLAFSTADDMIGPPIGPPACLPARQYNQAGDIGRYDAAEQVVLARRCDVIRTPASAACTEGRGGAGIPQLSCIKGYKVKALYPLSHLYQPALEQACAHDRQPANPFLLSSHRIHSRHALHAKHCSLHRLCCGTIYWHTGFSIAWETDRESSLKVLVRSCATGPFAL